MGLLHYQPQGGLGYGKVTRSSVSTLAIETVMYRFLLGDGGGVDMHGPIHSVMCCDLALPCLSLFRLRRYHTPNMLR